MKGMVLPEFLDYLEARFSRVPIPLTTNPLIDQAYLTSPCSKPSEAAYYLLLAAIPAISYLSAVSENMSCAGYFSSRRQVEQKNVYFNVTPSYFYPPAAVKYLFTTTFLVSVFAETIECIRASILVPKPIGFFLLSRVIN